MNNKPASLSDIVEYWEGKEGVAAIRIEAWRSMQLASISIEMNNGAMCSAVYCGKDFKNMEVFNPALLTSEERQQAIVCLTEEHNLKQTRVAEILGVSQATVSLDLKLWQKGKARCRTWAASTLSRFQHKAKLRAAGKLNS